MKFLKKKHPILWLNSIFASPLFIVAVNLIVFTCFIVAHFSLNKAADGERIDLGISWFTMGMDQIIISAGWLIYCKQQKDTKEIKKALGIKQKKGRKNAAHARTR